MEANEESWNKHQWSQRSRGVSKLNRLSLYYSDIAFAAAGISSWIRRQALLTPSSSPL
jgi:hypothetical protein